jgi:predicted transcriptional regulator
MLLATTMDGGTKMKIMSKAHLNNNQMKRYIAPLVSQNLIKEKIYTTNQSSLYQTTEKEVCMALHLVFRLIGKN